MGNEARKTAALWGDEIWTLVKGRGLDIGAGSDPITPNVKTFDKSQGDANRIDEYIYEQFDFVFSSHCLEHMRDPIDAIARWWKLVKPLGYLIVIVPDEDLYEQGWWPSLFNHDHKHTFTLNDESWSPVSVNMNELVKSLAGAEVVAITQQSSGYQRLIYEKRPKDRQVAYRRMWLAKKLTNMLQLMPASLLSQIPHWLGAPIDQTAHGALAQIQVIVRKSST
jgi:SAM-dependent methyltransferase